MLPGAEEVAGAPEGQILPGNLKAVVGLAQGLEPLQGFGIPVGGEQNAVGLRVAPPDPAAKLVELAQTEPVRVLDDHQRGVGHVHAHLDHGGGHQDIVFAPGKGPHGLVLLGGLHLSVNQGHPQIREHRLLQSLCPDLGGTETLVLPLLNGRADNVALVTLGHLLADEGVDPGPLVFAHQEGVDALAAGGQLVDDRNIQIPVQNQRQGPGDRGGGHDQDVGILSLLRQGGALGHAEAVLLIGNHQAQVGKVRGLGNQGVGADDEIHPVLCDLLPGRLLLRRSHGAGQQGRADPQRLHQLL